MHLKSVYAIDWPDTDIGWNQLDPVTQEALYVAATSRMLVNVSGSMLLQCATSLDFVHLDLDGDDEFTPFIDLHVIESYYSCICSIGDDCANLDLTRGIAPWALDRVEAHLVANNFDFSPTTESIFKQRLRLFASNSRIEQVILSVDDFVYLEPDGVVPPQGGGAACATPTGTAFHSSASLLSSTHCGRWARARPT